MQMQCTIAATTQKPLQKQVSPASLHSLANLRDSFSRLRNRVFYPRPQHLPFVSRTSLTSRSPLTLPPPGGPPPNSDFLCQVLRCVCLIRRQCGYLAPSSLVWLA